MALKFVKKEKSEETAAPEAPQKAPEGKRVEISPDAIHKDRWKVLIVDDEPDVHTVTELAVGDMKYEGKKLEFVHAYSGKECQEVMEKNPDVAAILLDVVMETDESGLEVCNWIRKEIGNHVVRIILRTGQPGVAPEREVIDNYDIDDYKNKAELTEQRLYTSIRSAIKSYRDLMTIEASRLGLRYILKATPEIYKLQPLKDLLQGVLTQISGFIGAESGFLITFGDGNALEFKVGTGDFTSNETLIKKYEEQSKVINEAVEEKRVIMQQDLTVIPLLFRNKPLGIVYFGNLAQYTSDTELLEIFANQSSAAVENIRLYQDVIEYERLTKELEIAQKIQEGLLPKKAPEVQGYKIGCFCKPAKEVGGDLFDFIDVDDDHLGLLIGDVEGKSVSGAMYMAVAKTMFRSVARESIVPKDVVIKVNRLLCEEIQEERFVTIFYCVLDIKNKVLNYACGGHNPPILYSTSSAPEKVTGGGMPLGISAEDIFNNRVGEGKVDLKPGTGFLMYTDGIPEAINDKNEEYTLPTLMEVIKKNSAQAPPELIESILNDVNGHIGETTQYDDMTLVGIKLL